MKKICLFLSIAAAFFLDCAKQEENTVTREEARYLGSFSMKVETVTTKANIDFSTGAVTWNDDDRVL